MCTPNKVCAFHAMSRLADELGANLQHTGDGLPFADIRADLFWARLELAEDNGKLRPRLRVWCESETKLTVARLIVMSDVLETFTNRCAYVRSILDSDGRTWAWTHAEIKAMNEEFDSWRRGIESGIDSALAGFRGFTGAGEA